ncbi:MAG: hypothetical protein M9962_04360 [Oligoflexia bacterium]|nr:hypothetical protein [Oligoflexia bacterium]
MKYLLSLMVIGFIISSCATLPYEPYAREVKKKPRNGGVIALRMNNRAEDRMKAESLMRYNCGDSNIVKVLEEGEVVVGEQTSSTSSRNNYPTSGLSFGSSGFSFGSASTDERETHSTTNQIREWQLTYECLADQNEGVLKKGKNISKK